MHTRTCRRSSVAVLFVSACLLVLPGAARASILPRLRVKLPSLGHCSDRPLPAPVRARVPWCSLARAIAAAPPGGIVQMHGGDYPFQDFHGLGMRKRFVTVEPLGYGTPNAQSVTIHGISTADSGHLRFRGLHLVGQDVTGFGPAARIFLGSRHIQLIDDDMSGQGVYVQGAAHVRIVHNRIHDLTRNCDIDHIGDGGGIFVQRSARVRILDNHIERTVQDAVNVGAIPHLVVSGNDMSNVEHSRCGDHTDLVQIEGGGRGPMTFTDNVFHDGGQFILRNATGLTIARNLMLRVANWMQLVADPRARVVDNTWWGGNRTCPGCGSLLIRDYGPRDNFARPPFRYRNHMHGTLVRRNVMRIFADDGVPRTDYREDENLIYGPRRNNSGLERAHTHSRVVALRHRRHAHRRHHRHGRRHGHHRRHPRAGSKARPIIRGLLHDLRAHRAQPQIIQTVTQIARRL